MTVGTSLRIRSKCEVERYLVYYKERLIMTLFPSFVVKDKRHRNLDQLELKQQRLLDHKNSNELFETRSQAGQ